MIENTKKYHGASYCIDVFAADHKEIPYLKAAEVLRGFDGIPAVDVAPVVHGRWIHSKKHLWYKDEGGNVDEWRVDVGFHNGPQCRVCGESFCMHCNPGWADEECRIGHYLCSECGETSTDAHESYCPNCGARMDGE